MTSAIPADSDDPASITPVPSIHSIPPADSSTPTSLPPAVFTQFQAWGTTLLNEVAKAIVTALMNVATDAENAFEALATFGEEVFSGIDSAQQADADWTTLLEALGESVTNATTLAAWLSGINNTAANAQANWDSFLGDIGLSPTDIATLSAWWNGLFGWLTGTSTTPALTSGVSAPSVTNTATDAQPVSNFPNPSSIAGGGGWSYDGFTNYGGSGGSVKFTASGAAGGLRGVVIPVQANQTLVLAAQVQWAGLTTSGSNPIQLQLIPGTLTAAGVFTAGTPVEVAQIASPGASASWTALTGTYTVPSSGVSAVQVRLVVTANATAGNVWWAACTTAISGGYIATIDALTQQLHTESQASTAAFGTLLTSWESAITGYTNWSTFMTALQTAWNTYTTTESGLESAEIFTLQQLFNTLLGINTSTGQMSQTNVASSTGLTSLENDVSNAVSSLSTDWTNLVAGAENTWNSLFGAAPTSGTQTIGQDVVNGLTNVWDWLTGTTTPTSSTQVQATAVSSSLGGGSTSLGSDMSSVNTATAVAAAAATTAGTNASIAIAANQATKDAIVSATTGAPVTGTSTTDVTTGLSNIPSTNIVGQTGAAVTFGAVGAGNSTNLGGATSGSISWSHTIATGDLNVLVLTAYSVPISQTATSTVTYGGTAMTLLQRELSSVSGGSAFVATEAWVLKAPPSGSKTVSVSVSGANFNPISGNSVSYSASKVGTVGPNTGGGSSSMSMSAASTTGKMVVGAFGIASSFSGLPTLSAYSQTQRYNSFGLVIGDAAGASSVAFAATASGTASLVEWAGITVELEN